MDKLKLNDYYAIFLTGGQKIQPFWIESEAKKIPGTNYINGGMFKAFAVRDGHLITGQQQFSGAKAAELVVEALGV
ncbi:MAG: hypothetical protein MH321_14680 [Leptospiraceae bacterium]|nr:hypothetical protein [Leptospiraceae bacterium]